VLRATRALRAANARAQRCVTHAMRNSVHIAQRACAQTAAPNLRVIVAQNNDAQQKSLVA
jgi:transposase-like protein